MNLYAVAAEQNIEVLTYPMALNESMSVMGADGCCYIGMDKSVRDGSAEERVHLAHELGHCITGSFYNVHSPADIRQKHEHKADKWAICQLVPQEELCRCHREGRTELWDLADYFGVSIPFMRKAVCYYKTGSFNIDEVFPDPFK